MADAENRRCQTVVPACTGEPTHTIVSLGDVFVLCDTCLAAMDAKAKAHTGKTFVELLLWQEKRRN